jgi:hypothetical protein
MQSLLDLLRGHWQQQALDESEFAALVNIAEEENVLPWVAERMRLLDCEFSLPQSKQLDEIQRQAQLSSFLWIESLKSILAGFHQSNLPVITLKGPCLAERIYGDASLRTCYDLDLLVRRSDFARAEQLLTDLGFSPNGHADDYHRPWSRSGLNLELHHNVENPHAFEFDIDAAWGRTRLSQFHGAPVWLFAPSDELLYLCLHAVRHRFERLCLILDLGLAFRRLPLPSTAAAEWSSPVFGNIFALGWIMATCLNPKIYPKIDPEIPFPQAMRVSPADLSRLERLGRRLWQELLLAPQKTLDWAAQHRFFLEVETPGWNRLRRRWRHRRILLTRLIDDDFVFAGRFNLHRIWQVRLLRPIRLLMKKLHASSRTV